MPKFIQVTHIDGQRTLIKINHIKRVTEQSKSCLISTIDGSQYYYKETFDEIKTLLENKQNNG